MGQAAEGGPSFEAVAEVIYGREIGRRLVGSDHRLLTPLSCLIGALLLLLSDTLGRIMVGSGALPVGVITSFMGAPLFLYLLLRGYQK